MKKVFFAVFGLVLLAGCHKGHDGNPCDPEENQQAWKKDEGNPIFVKGEKSWDDGIILGHCVIKSGNIFKMWYSAGHEVFSLNIGYATSTDGIHWTRYSGNPVFTATAGSWDELGASIPVVLQDGNTLHMWYLGGPGPDGGRFGYATSEDGIHWNRHPSPVFESAAGGWYRDAILPGTVIKEKGIFKMWFSGSIGSLQQSTPTTENSIGYATSPDGINWKVYDNPATTDSPYQSSDPVLKHGAPGEWDFTSALTPTVIKTRCGYEMWYTGENLSAAEQHIGYAFSQDGIHWVKHPQNPVLTMDPWNISLVFPSVILDGNKYRMWYGGFLLNGDALGGAIGYVNMPKQNIF
jgi:predicted GH43/DUF377 family glycosyl hydrolase